MNTQQCITFYRDAMNKAAEMLKATSEEKKRIIELQTSLFESVKTMQELTDMASQLYGPKHETAALIIAALEKMLKTKSKPA